MSYMFIGDSGTVVFDRTGTVTGEDAQYSGTVTKNPIERGGQINDHANIDPVKLNVSGIVANDGGRETLVAMQRNRDLISYRGVEAHDNLVMTSLAITRSVGNSGGYTFKASFQQVRISSAAFIPVTGPTMSQMDTGASAISKSNSKPSSQGMQTTTQTPYMDYTSQFYGPVSSGPGQPANPASAGFRREG